ncbi:uncharacterized protein LOC123309560 [Coccinella septempunctata]|uniref:uncharacterized protein LOC123309560 n=1 Tax=Coccinella septempunctata TaxID=41139 RepID=UPI001D089E6D|nr:uncharacterized protein LOC123309560 [Coccinella septempunctata]
MYGGCQKFAGTEYRNKHDTVAKILNQEFALNHQHLSSKNYFEDTYHKNPNIRPSFHRRLSCYLNDINYVIPDLLQAYNSHTPPWIVPTAHTNTRLTKYCRNHINQQIIHNHFKSIQDEYINAQFYYTDASSTDGGETVGFAVVSPREIRKYKMEGSVFSGELTAIHHALLEILDEQHEQAQYVVCTDSLSAIKIIEQTYPRHPLAQQIQHLLYLLHQRHRTVTFIYVPSHTGIKGNELADEAAKEALESQHCKRVFIGEEANIQVKRKIESKWQEEWIDSPSHLKNVKPTPLRKSFYPSGRRNQIKVSRLRSGHTKLTHGFLLSREEPPQCDLCETRVTVKHVISECTKFQAKRHECGVSARIEVALGNNNKELEKTLNFLKEIELYYKI